METTFIEFLDGLFYGGYASCFVDENPEAYYRQLAEFSNLYKRRMKTHLYLTVRVEVESELNLLDCVRELEKQSEIKISDTPNVRVLEIAILLSVLPIKN
ncbi:hypothetical protein [Pedobacter sp. V48]|uniref:hypothetical protein n=1 Tax=Pedobacter sp. V48 TaxID=509635 RepID=UPI0003E57BD7|nr:hypothetical protein [Pedobacter sp. V48]ETZ20188.1 hypothetical protein N824_08220 [Pedobacter sp. V48]